MLFSILKHDLDTDTALKKSQSVYCFTTSISHGVENYFPRLWGTGISDAILFYCLPYNILYHFALSECILFKSVPFNSHILRYECEENYILIINT